MTRKDISEALHAINPKIEIRQVFEFGNSGYLVEVKSGDGTNYSYPFFIIGKRGGKPKPFYPSDDPGAFTKAISKGPVELA